MDITVLSPNEAQNALLLNWMATEIAKEMGLHVRVPTALVGGVGCGKTDSVRSFAVRLKGIDEGAKLWNVRMSHILPEDLGGYAAKNEESKRLTYYMSESLPFDSDELGVIFLDEFDRASEQNQNAALPLVYGDEFHGHFISTNAYVVLALNGEADEYTTPLSNAARSRVCSIFVKRDLASYIDWATKNGIPDNVIQFHRDHGELFGGGCEFSELAICTSRTLDMAGMISLARDRLGERISEKVYQACIYGVIGLHAGSKYLLAERLNKLIDFKGIFETPESVEMPAFENYQYIIGVVVNRCKNDHSLVGAVITWGKRITSREWQQHLKDELIRVLPDDVKLGHRLLF